MICSVPYLTRNIMNKFDRFDRLALPINYITEYNMPSSFSIVCHKPIWSTNVLNVAVPSDNFQGFLMWLNQVGIY